jgi:hypothetical protein
MLILFNDCFKKYLFYIRSSIHVVLSVYAFSVQTLYMFHTDNGVMVWFAFSGTTRYIISKYDVFLG